MTTPEPTEAPNLAARYGRTASSKRRTRWIAVTSALAFVAVFTAWVLWAGLLGAPAAQFEAKDAGYSIDSDSEVTVRWQFSTDPGNTASCAVQALNSTFGIVGWKVVDLPASTQHTRSFEESVLTTELGVTGLIYRCWLT